MTNNTSNKILDSIALNFDTKKNSNMSTVPTLGKTTASSSIINSIAQKKKNTISTTAQTKVPSFLPYLPQAAKETVVKTADKAWDFAKAILQAPQRTLTSVAIQPIADTLSLTTGKDIKPIYIPKTKIEKAIFGEEPIKGIGERTVEAQKKGQQLLGGSSTATGASLALAPLFVGALTALDLTPVGGTEKNAAKIIAKTTDKNIITGLLRKIGVTEDLIESYASKFVKTTSEKEVETGLKQLDNILKTTKTTAEVAPTVAQVAERAKPVTDVIATETAKTAGKITQKTRPDLFAGNVRVDKISSEEDVQQLLKNTAEQFKDKMNDQTRGVVSHKVTEELANDLGLTTDQVIKSGRTGKAYTAEYLSAMSAILKKTSDDTVRLAQQYIKTQNIDDLLNYRNALEKHAALQTVFSGAKAESGRALEIQKVLAREVPTSAEAKAAMLKALGGREVNDEIAKRMAYIEDLYSDNREAGIAAINKFIRDVSKPKMTDKIFEVWLNSILANPITQIVNTTSNTIRALYQVPVKYYQALLSPEVTIKEANSYAIGLATGLDEASKRLWFVLKNGLGPEELSKIEFRVPAIKGKLGEVVRMPTKLLSATDEFFKIVSGTAELNAMAYRNAFKEGLQGKKLIERIAELKANPTMEMMNAVKKRQLDVTFQQELSKTMNTLIGFRDAVPGLRYVVPFVRTPLNIMKEAAALSPLGLVKMGRKLAKGEYKFKSPEQAEDLAKATLGSVLLIGVVYEFLKGNITGNVPEGTAQRDAFYREGKQPYSVKIGDTWFSYRRIEPFATTFGITADILESIRREDEEPTQTIKQLIGIIGRNLTDKTFMAGLSGAMNAIADPERYGERFTSSLASGFVPFSGTLGWISRIQDQIIRNPKGVKEKIYSRLPFLQETIVPKRNVWGETIKREGGALMQAVSPISITKERNDPVDIELKKLDYFVGFPSQTITIPKNISIALGLDEDARKIKLKSEEYDFLLNAGGYFAKQKLGEIFNDPQYQEMDEAEKIKVVNSVVNNVREQTRMMVLNMIFTGEKF